MGKYPTTGYDYLTELMSQGIYHFTTLEAQKAFHNSPVAARAVVRRLKRKGLINTPYRGFHVVVPAEYKAFSSLPADQFIPQLMAHLETQYYVGLLSAAQMHGAAHQKPQYFQVVVPKNRPEITCGRVRVMFVARENLATIPTETRNTPRGYLRLSTPEGTALDLVTYPNHAGGLGNVITVLTELSEKMDPKTLLKVARGSGPLPYVQRLGFLLDQLKLKKLANPLADFVANHAKLPTLLAPGLPSKNSLKNKRWNLIVNTAVEGDL